MLRVFLFVEARFQIFDVVVAQVVQPEVKEGSGGGGKLEVCKTLIAQRDRVAEARQNPLVDWPQSAELRAQLGE